MSPRHLSAVTSAQRRPRRHTAASPSSPTMTPEKWLTMPGTHRNAADFPLVIE